MSSDDWQLIETAPKDGTEVWGAWPNPKRTFLWEHSIMNWDAHRKRWVGDRNVGDITPTHWQPLPDPPEVSDE